jgi:hypothetical protein
VTLAEVGMRGFGWQIKPVTRFEMKFLAADLEYELSAQNPETLVLGMTVRRIRHAWNIIPLEGRVTFLV